LEIGNTNEKRSGSIVGKELDPPKKEIKEREKREKEEKNSEPKPYRSPRPLYTVLKVETKFRKRGGIRYAKTRFGINARTFRVSRPLPPVEEPTTSFSNYLKRGVLIIERSQVSMSISNENFLLYQMIGVSRVHRSKHQINQKIYRYIDKNNSDLLILEDILLPRRRRELRILTCFNPGNNKVVDKNPVFYNGNRVKNGSQFFDKSKDLDRDKKKLIKFKSFLWPNYRLEDLACMNRYWIHTNNGSRFSMLRIRMYPRLKTHLLYIYLIYSLSSSR